MARRRCSCGFVRRRIRHGKWKPIPAGVLDLGTRIVQGWVEGA